MNTVAMNTVAMNTVAMNTVAMNTVAMNTVAMNTVAMNTVAMNTVAMNTVAMNTVDMNTVDINTVDINTQQPFIIDDTACGGAGRRVSPAKNREREFCWFFLPLFMLWLVSFSQLSAATLRIVNNDATSVGLNSPLATQAVGGNSATTLGEQRLKVLQKAARIVEASLHIPIDVEVLVAFSALECDADTAVLGSAGATEYIREAGNDEERAQQASAVRLPLSRTWYPIALANTLNGKDLSEFKAGIVIYFNGAIDNNDDCLANSQWYYGFDSPAKSDITQLSLLSISIHELLHGLGFASLVGPLKYPLNGYFDVYSRLLYDARVRRSWDNMPWYWRYYYSRTNNGNVIWQGGALTQAAAALPLTDGFDHNRVELYAPRRYRTGSSISHFSRTLKPDQIMEPFHDAHTPAEVGLAAELLQDLGWQAPEPNKPVQQLANIIASSASAPPDPRAGLSQRTHYQVPAGWGRAPALISAASELGLTVRRLCWVNRTLCRSPWRSQAAVFYGPEPFHVIALGEGLWKTTLLFGLPLQHVREINNDLLSGRRWLYVGDVLFSSATVRQAYILDDDDDGYSDVIEQFVGTDSLDDASVPKPFQLTIQTAQPGVSADNQYLVPAHNARLRYDYAVDCDSDGRLEVIHQTGPYVCQYEQAGEYTLSVYGLFPHFNLASHLNDPDKLLRVEQWGDNPWLSFHSMFKNASNLELAASDSPDLSQLRDMSFAFYNANKFNQPVDHWDVSSVTHMRGLFGAASRFNQSLNNWNTAAVTDMAGLFYRASNFNQPLDRWNVAAVTDMAHLFDHASAFNQPLNNWSVSQVSDMSYMFYTANAFDRPLGQWNVSAVTDMKAMFAAASAFNQPLNDWSVSQVSDMSYMFYAANRYNQSLNLWDVSKVEAMHNMLLSANMSTSRYDALLNAWSQLSLQNQVPFGISTQYSAAGSGARSRIIDEDRWGISDLGIEE